VRACVWGVSGTRHDGLWLRCVLPARNDRLRGASSPHSTAGVYKFIMPSSGIRNRVRDFENRNNTNTYNNNMLLKLFIASLFLGNLEDGFEFVIFYVLLQG